MSARVIVAVTGASGALYADRTLKVLLENGHHVDLVLSRFGARLLKEERDLPGSAAEMHGALRERYGDAMDRGTITPHANQDLGSRVASGSAPIHGMVIVPASMKTVATVATGAGDSLVDRAAMVTLKERRPLVVVPRETPLNRIHIENFLRLHDAGAVLLPANPGFYFGAETLEDLGDFIAARIMDRLGLSPAEDLVPRWNPGGDA